MMYKPDPEIELDGWAEWYEQRFKGKMEYMSAMNRMNTKNAWIQSRRQLLVKHGAGIDKLKESVKYIESHQEEYGCTELLNKLLKEVWDYIEEAENETL